MQETYCDLRGRSKIRHRVSHAIVQRCAA
jgi:hypothetical protein